MSELTIEMSMSLSAQNAGLFISRGVGRHPTRVIRSYELIFVIEDYLSIQEEQHFFQIHSGESFILCPNKIHGGTEDYLENLKYYWIHFDFLNHNLSSKQNSQAFNIQKHVKVKNQERLIELFRWFLDSQGKGDLKQIEADILINLILFEICKSNNKTENKESQKELLANSAKQYIKTHFHNSINASSIAQALCYNPDYLGRIYKEITNETITESIHSHRIWYAKKLLMSSIYNINEIGLRSGFDDPCYFRRVFKRKEGIPPGAYRCLYSHRHVNTE